MRGTGAHNPEARRLVLGLAAGGLAVLALAAVSLSVWWTVFNRAVMDRDAALIGRLLAADPGASLRIMAALGRAATPAEAAAGREAERSYGYDAGLPPSLNPVLHGPFLSSVALSVALCLFGISWAILYARSVLGFTLHRVRAVADAAERITQGDPGLRIHEDGEGDVSLLGHRVNQMAERLLAALEQLQREKEYLKGFLTDVSHQLKTPLASVRMFTDLALDGVGEEKKKEFLESSQGQLDRMEWLIANLLAVARMEAGAVEFNVTEEPLEATVSGVLAGLRGLAERAGLSVNWQAPAAAVLTPHDRRWLGEALSNIFKNCIEHTPAGGSIAVSLVHTNVLARITIEDTGEGIANEDLPRIFDRFFQPAAPAAGPGGYPEGAGPAPSGTGVGLALARAIIERHHGIVSVESRPGRGSRFVVTLPLRDI